MLAGRVDGAAFVDLDNNHRPDRPCARLPRDRDQGTGLRDYICEYNVSNLINLLMSKNIQIQYFDHYIRLFVMGIHTAESTNAPCIQLCL